VTGQAAVKEYECAAGGGGMYPTDPDFEEQAYRGKPEKKRGSKYRKAMGPSPLVGRLSGGTRVRFSKGE